MHAYSAISTLICRDELTQEGHHRQATVLDLCCLQTEDLFCIFTAGEAQGVEEAACSGMEQTTAAMVSVHSTQNNCMC